MSATNPELENVLLSSLPASGPSPLLIKFRAIFFGMRMKTIKQTFRTFKQSVTGDAAISFSIDQGHFQNREEAVPVFSQFLQAKMVASLTSTKDIFKDSAKHVYALSLKGKILLYGSSVVKKCIEKIQDPDEEALESSGGAANLKSLILSDDEAAFLAAAHFCLYEMDDLMTKNNTSNLLRRKMMRRMFLLPEGFLTEFSDLIMVQGLTGLNIEIKERSYKRQVQENTFYGIEATEWILFNTSIETREQAVALGNYFVLYGLFEPISGGKFEDSKSVLLRLSDIGLSFILEAFEVDEPDMLDGQGATRSRHVSSTKGGIAASNVAATYAATKSVQYQLRKLLADPDLTKVFHAYLCSLFCSENLDFYQEVVRYKSLFDVVEDGVAERLDLEEIKACGTHLYDTWIRDDDLNVPQRQKESLKKQVETENFTENTFDASQKHVFDMMATDSYKKFLKSSYFKDHIVGNLADRLAKILPGGKLPSNERLDATSQDNLNRKSGAAI